tara:strand:- start:200 stop:502 length:303 start_codon:yes stop_codon:yes gene_type:complete
MKEEETAPLKILLHALDVNRKNCERIEWQEEFINYIEEKNIKLYNEAKKYTDKLEADDYWTEEQKKIWGMKEETKHTCCGDEITQQVKEIGICPTCLKNI